MKNKILNAFTIAAISCTSLASLANQNYYKDQSLTHKEESSTLNNLMSDISITISIKKQFLFDDKINAFNIRVTSVNDKVKLTGVVPTEADKKKVIYIAERTKGVKQVVADLQITDASLIKAISSDSLITARIKISLLDDSDTSALDVNVKTVNGKVTLSGKVPSEKVKKKTILLAKEVRSVKEVVDRLEIDKSSHLKNIPSDSAITSIVKLRYFEDNELSGLDIHVTTIDGEVTLSGIVPTEKNKEKAISIAKLTNGVTKVISNLKTQY